jgi:hypothetical protein
MWNKYALSIVEEGFKVVRRELELAWQVNDRPIPLSHALIEEAIRAGRELHISTLQRDGRFLEIWRTHLRAVQRAEGNDPKEADDAEEKDALDKLFRDPFRRPPPA